jgi:D-alanyl-D-alanine carboxypeptidase
MISDMEDMKTWVKAYVTGITNSQSTQKTRLDCVPTGKEGLRFGLGVGCTGGWYGYTGGIPEYHTAAYYLPSAEATMIVLVNSFYQLEVVLVPTGEAGWAC